MIARIHSNWDSDIVLGEGELEKIIQGKILSGEIVNYDQIGKVSLSINENKFATVLYLDWDSKDPLKYHFKITLSGLERLKENNFIHGIYENGFNGSKLGIYGHGKDNFTKEDIGFAIQMIKLDKKSSI